MALADDIANLPTTPTAGQTGRLANDATVIAGLKSHETRVTVAKAAADAAAALAGTALQLDGNGLVPDNRIPAGIARDSEITAAVLVETTRATTAEQANAAAAAAALAAAQGSVKTVNGVSPNSSGAVTIPTGGGSTTDASALTTGTLSDARLSTATTTALASAGTAVQPAGLTKAAVGLANVDNTTDTNKPVSTAQATALAAKATTAQLTAETTRATAAEAARTPLLTPTVTKTAAYTVAVGERAMMNVAGGATALLLPTAPTDQATVGFRAGGATTAVPLVVTAGSGDTIGPDGANTATITLAGKVDALQYDAVRKSWLLTSGIPDATVRAAIAAETTRATAAEATKVTSLVYASGAYPPRPSDAPGGAVTYIGPVQPTTWLANDSWTDNS